MVRFPDDETDESGNVIAKPPSRRKHLPPVFTKRELLDRGGMKDYREPQESGIRDVMEGPIIGQLLYIFRQIDEMRR